jgi:hypothetical protein
MLMTPKPNRLLVSEMQMPQENEGKASVGSVKQKKSMKRISDILKGHERSDLWVV